MARTRVKICGITRPDDLDAALAAGADAIGFVFFPPSPRFVDIQRAAALIKRVPPFVACGGLFVNAEPHAVADVLAAMPLDLLQFHGDEDVRYCERFSKPYVKAARMAPGLDLVEFTRTFASAQGILLDAYVESYGGAGETFDWSRVPESLPLPIILSGGLTADNVGEAIRVVHPWAVDVSSGVESAKGIKDASKITAFVAAVRSADAR